MAGETFADAGIGEVIGGYRLERLLGAGSTSQVFLGTHVRLGRPAAIKVLSQALLDNKDVVSRLLTEARVVNDVRHPNIVDIIDFVESENPARVALVMEYIEGPSLKALRDYPLSREQALGIALQLVVAVQAAHDAGVIHRDIKPDNLLLTRDPRAEGSRKVPRLKIVDFGIAKLSGTSANTVAGMMLGTPAYMAPEQVAGRPPPSSATDVFAIGEVIYELLSGQRAYPAVAIHETVRAKLRGELPKLELPPMPGDKVLLSLITRCLASKPQERPPLQEVRDTLLNLAPLPDNTGKSRDSKATNNIREVLDSQTSQWLNSIHADSIKKELPASDPVVPVLSNAAIAAVSANEKTIPPELAGSQSGVIVSSDFMSQGASPADGSFADLPPLAATELIRRIPMDNTSPTSRNIAALTEPADAVATGHQDIPRPAVRGGGSFDPRELRTDPPTSPSFNDVTQKKEVTGQKRPELMSFGEDNVTDLGDSFRPGANDSTPGSTAGLELLQRAGMAIDEDSLSGLTPNTPHGVPLDVNAIRAAKSSPFSQPSVPQPPPISDLGFTPPPSPLPEGVLRAQPIPGAGSHKSSPSNSSSKSAGSPPSKDPSNHPPSNHGSGSSSSSSSPLSSDAQALASSSASALAAAAALAARPAMPLQSKTPQFYAVPKAAPAPPPARTPVRQSAELAAMSRVVQPRKRNRAGMLLAIGSLWLIASALIWFAIGGKLPGVQDQHLGSGGSPAGRVVVNSLPAGARVEAADSGKLLGVTPLEIDPESVPKRVRITADGYQPVEIDVVQTNTRIWVELESITPQ